MIQIKSKGYIEQNNNNHVEGMKWNADYDGHKANIQLDVNKNGHVQRRKIQLHNKQLGTLAQLLSVPSVNKPLEKRISDDYEDDYDDNEEDASLFQNYISTPRRMMRRNNTPQIVRIKLEPMEQEQEFPDVFQNEYEDDEYNDNTEEDPRQEMMMMEQLLNETQSSNRSHKKKTKNKRHPTHKVRFSPRNSSRTNKRITLRGGRKRRGTRRRRLKR